MIRIPRNRWVAVLAILAAAAGVSAWYFVPANKTDDSAVIARVKK